MSQISCKQSIRIEMTGWFKHYFTGNLKRNFLFRICNYTSYQNLQKTSLPNPFAREKAGDKAGQGYLEHRDRLSAFLSFVLDNSRADC